MTALGPTREDRFMELVASHRVVPRVQGRALGACLAAAVVSAQAAPSETTMLLRGRYEGKNLLVRNPAVPGSSEPCIVRIEVDGNPARLTGDGVEEVMLSQFKLKLRDPLVVRISHRAGCTPKVLDPQAIGLPSQGSPARP